MKETAGCRALNRNYIVGELSEHGIILTNELNL